MDYMIGGATILYVQEMVEEIFPKRKVEPAT